jgi:RNA polymerase sigma-70 factor (ECF subfamily)
VISLASSPYLFPAVAVIISETVTDATFQSIFAEHKHAVYRFAWRMTGSAEAADDVAQDCFMTLWTMPERFDAKRGSIRAFLMGIARNSILKRWRTESRWDSLQEDAFVAAPVDVVRLEIADVVAEAVQALPALQREALILAEYEDMKLEDVARAVDAELTTVKARLHRARENLRRMLAPMRNSTCNL